VREGHFKVADVLLQRGIDVNAKGRDGLTLLDTLICNWKDAQGYEEVFDTFCRYGLDFEVKGNLTWGNTWDLVNRLRVRYHRALI
jgi:hypothetical protein